MAWRSDLVGLIQGLQKVGSAIGQQKAQDCQRFWANSSLKNCVPAPGTPAGQRVADALRSPSSTARDIADNAAEAIRRSGNVAEGLRQFVVVALGSRSAQAQQAIASAPAQPGEELEVTDDPILRGLDTEREVVQPLTVMDKTKTSPQEVKPGAAAAAALRAAPIATKEAHDHAVPHHHRPSHQHKEAPKTEARQKFTVRPGTKPLARNDPGSRLSAQAKERKVPSSRISRLMSYGSLAAGLGAGAIAEVTRRSLGFAEPKKTNGNFSDSPFLTEANVERIVDTLCKVRGAALKLGQMLSIQDQSMLDPQLMKIFDRVRQSADFMPTSQVEDMMLQEFGEDWRSKVASFDEKPFAAASIGEVHLAKLHDGRKVAVKIQYPGVAEGIESDINNLMSVMQMGNIFPKGLYLEEFIKVARMELNWEVDYIREAECARRYRKDLEPYNDYYVPEVIEELSASRIFTTELIEGITLDKFEDYDQETRDRIGYLAMRLFVLELFGFQFMQTDPNWANFLYNTETGQLGLLDFGSCRAFDDEFVGTYIRIIRSAVDRDREKVLEYSRQIGFLTGYEKKAMEQAHVDSVMILGEAFKEGGGVYDFGSQDISPRVQRMIGVMLEHRLCPPPEEVYSLHRKLSGVFLLCTKLRSRVDCTTIFEEAWQNYLSKKPEWEDHLHGKL